MPPKGTYRYLHQLIGYRLAWDLYADAKHPIPMPHPTHKGQLAHLAPDCWMNLQCGHLAFGHLVWLGSVPSLQLGYLPSTVAQTLSPLAHCVGPYQAELLPLKLLGP